MEAPRNGGGEETASVRTHCVVITTPTAAASRSQDGRTDTGQSTAAESRREGGERAVRGRWEGGERTVRVRREDSERTVRGR